MGNKTYINTLEHLADYKQEATELFASKQDVEQSITQLEQRLENKVEYFEVVENYSELSQIQEPKVGMLAWVKSLGGATSHEARSTQGLWQYLGAVDGWKKKLNHELLMLNLTQSTYSNGLYIHGGLVSDEITPIDLTQSYSFDALYLTDFAETTFSEYIQQYSSIGIPVKFNSGNTGLTLLVFPTNALVSDPTTFTVNGESEAITSLLFTHNGAEYIAKLTIKLVNKSVSGTPYNCSLSFAALGNASDVKYKIVDYVDHNHNQTTGTTLNDILNPTRGMLAYVCNDLYDERLVQDGSATSPEDCIGYWTADGNTLITHENYKTVTINDFNGPTIYEDQEDYLGKYKLVDNEYVLITDDNLEELVVAGETESYEFNADLYYWIADDELPFAANPKGFYQYLPSATGLLHWQYVQLGVNLLPIVFNSTLDVHQTYTFTVDIHDIEQMLWPTFLRVIWSGWATMLPAICANFIIDSVSSNFSTSCLVHLNNKDYNAVVKFTNDNGQTLNATLSFIDLNSGVDYIQAVVNNGSVIIELPRGLYNEPERVTGVNDLITYFNYQFDVEIPAYTKIEDLATISQYINSLENTEYYAPLKVIYYSSVFAISKYLALGIKCYISTTGEVCPCWLNATFDTDNNNYSYSVKYLSADTNPLAFTSLIDSTNYEPIHLYVNEID